MYLRNEFDNIPAVTDDLVEHFAGFLNDYTTDRRGDIGSLIRVEALQGAKAIIHSGLILADHDKCVQKLVGCITRLAAEKLDKVRFQAWLCLQDFWELQSDFPLLIGYVFDTSNHSSLMSPLKFGTDIDTGHINISATFLRQNSSCSSLSYDR